MDKKADRKVLGRGLSSLMADIRVEADPMGSRGQRSLEQRIPLEQIRANPDQPRRDFDRKALEELAESIRQKGIIQPLILRKQKDTEFFEIVAGERRWRAAQMARVHDVPAIVREYNDVEVLEIAIIENIQRADLNPVEEAMAYRQLMNKFGHTQEKIAEALGRSRSHIANSLRLLGLPTTVLDLLRLGHLTPGHVRPLIGKDNAAELAAQIHSKGLSVREVERMAKRVESGLKSHQTNASRSRSVDADTRAIETELAAHIGMLVRIEHAPGGEGGKLTITYRNLDQLDHLCAALSGMSPDDKI